MKDLHSLTDAFTELERRADVASAEMTTELPSRAVRRSTRPGARLVPVAAAVAAAVVAGLVTGVALLGRDGDPGSQSGAQPVSAPVSAPPSSVSGLGSGPEVMTDPQEFAARFQAVLGDTATFTVTDTGSAMKATVPPPPSAGAVDQGAPVQAEPNGTAIVGTLTAYGVTGGFDLQVLLTDPGAESWCDSPEPDRCTMSTLADGSSLAVGQVPLEGSSNGVTYMVNLIRPDGVELLMHLSNQRSPKGGSEVLAPHPPLTIDQMIGIVTSDRW